LPSNESRNFVYIVAVITVKLVDDSLNQSDQSTNISKQFKS